MAEASRKKKQIADSLYRKVKRGAAERQSCQVCDGPARMMVVNAEHGEYIYVCNEHRKIYTTWLRQSRLTTYSHEQVLQKLHELSLLSTSKK